MIVLSRNLFDAAALPAAVAAGGAAAVLALLALTVGETDDAFANAYSAAVSLQNLVPAAPLRLLVTLTTALGVIGALTIDLVSYQTFLLLLGSFFVPLFAVMLADWLFAGGRYEPETHVFAARAWRDRADRRLAGRVRALPVALSDRAVVVGRRHGASESTHLGNRCHRSELRCLVPRGRPRGGARPPSRRRTPSAPDDTLVAERGRPGLAEKQVHNRERSDDAVRNHRDR